MIFVYLGHWSTQYTTAFAYAFHLQLFFLVAGFFATRTSKRGGKEWILKQTSSLLIPYFLWVIISFWINNVDNTEFSNKDFWSLIVSPSEIQPNYWFFPAFIAVSTIYFVFYKVFKRPLVIFIFSLILHLLLGETPIVPMKYNIFSNVAEWPFVLRLVNNWFAISSIPHYLFWYSLGAISFNHIKAFTESKEGKNYAFYCIGGISGIFSMFLFFNKITEVKYFYTFIYMNPGTLESYRILCCIIILCFVFFISKIMEESIVLNNIGKCSMNFMGLEYITHSYFALTFLPMINLGIPNINSTIGVLTVTVIQIVINYWISNRINKYFPILNGEGLKRKK